MSIDVHDSRRKLDSGLPAVAMLTWLEKMLRPSNGIDWSVTDCGEQSGFPPAGIERDVPVCVTYSAAFDTDSNISISVILGTHEKGVIDRPEVYDISLVHHGKTIRMNRLEDIPRNVGKAIR